MANPVESQTQDKVCDICGDAGYTKDIVTCCQCKRISEHIYCMPSQLFSVPKDWHCEGCLASERVSYTKRKTVEISCSNVNKSRTPVKRSSPSNYEGNNEQISVNAKQHTGTQKPLCTQDCSSKMPDIGKERVSITGSASGLHVRHPLSCSSSSKMVENAKVKFIPSEELLTFGVKARICRTWQSSGVLLARTNQENIVHSPESPRISSNISLTANSEAIHQQKEGIIKAEVQVSSSKSNLENVVNDREENIHNHSDSGKEAFGTLCKKEPMEESVGLEVYNSPSKHVIPTESRCNFVAPPLPSDEERKREMIKVLEKEGHSAPIKEEPMEGCSTAWIYGSPSNITKPMESKSAVATLLPTSGVEPKLGANMSIDAQVNRSGYQKKDLHLLVVSDDKHPHRPVAEALWKGEFEVFDIVSHVYQGIEAHIPGKVSLNAYNMLKQLPEKIKFKLLRRIDVWPRTFQLDPPGMDDIGLYFFPSEPVRSKEKYIHLLERIDKSDLAMQSCIGNVELLIFTSKQMSKDSQVTGFAMEMFMWGVFRHLKHKKHNLHGREQFPAQTCSRLNVSAEINSEITAVEGMNNAYSQPNLSPESNSEINMLVSSDIGRINGPIPGPDVPPGFSKPFFRNKEYAKRSYAPGMVMGPAISDIPPGFSKPYSSRNGSSSSRKDSRCHVSSPPSVGSVTLDVQAKLHRIARENG